MGVVIMAMIPPGQAVAEKEHCKQRDHYLEYTGVCVVACLVLLFVIFWFSNHSLVQRQQCETVWTYCDWQVQVD